MNDLLNNATARIWFLYGCLLMTFLFGAALTFFIGFGNLILPQAITIVPSRIIPFDNPVCPGDSADVVFEYQIERPSVLEVDAVVYDVDARRTVRGTEIDTVSRPMPYAIHETISTTLTIPDFAPGPYEWHLGVTPKNQSSTTSFIIIAFEIAGDCPSNDVSSP